MKNKIKSFEDFEKRFKDQTLPEVHYKEHLTSKVIKHKKVPVFIRASLISIFITLFITVSIATAMQFTGWKFFDSEGKQVYEMTSMSEEEAEPHYKYDEIYAKYRVTMNKIKMTIPKGEFKYFQAVEGYEQIPDSSVSLLSNGEKIESVNQIPKSFMSPLHLEDVIEDGFQNKYMLIEGTLHYDFPTQDIDEFRAMQEEMYIEAKENNLPYSEKAGILTTDISLVELRYNKSKFSPESIYITLTPASERMLTTDKLAGYTQVTEGGVDFLVNEVNQNMYFIKEGNSRKLLVSISFTLFRGEIPAEKEELISIAQSLLN